VDRREFLIRSGWTTGAVALAPIRALGRAPLDGVAIVAPAAASPATAAAPAWARDLVAQALTARGYPVRTIARVADARADELCITSDVRAVANRPEGASVTFRTASGRRVLEAVGTDTRGLVYALTDVADVAARAAEPLEALEAMGDRADQSATPVRSVMRLFTSDIEDKGWFNDRGFWREYLSRLAAERFNRFNLALGLGYDFARELKDTYFYFAYPFLVSVPGFSVRATNLTDAERDRNLEQLRFISDEAVARGLEFQLGVWTHAYTWENSPDVNHVIEGLTDGRHAEYSRMAMAQVLRACPNISGVTLRIHGESGVTEGSYDFWKTIFQGVVDSGRRMRLDLHAKGIDRTMIDNALATGLPLTVSPKFWAEHMGLPYHQAAIRPNELPVPGRVVTGLMNLSTGERSFTRYGYADLLTGDRRYSVVHRIWPGTQRVLLWGDPEFAAAYARVMTFCGSVGCEIMEPLSFKGRKGSGVAGGRTAYRDASLGAAAHDAEKFNYTYRVWGRALYGPTGSAGAGRRLLAADCGAAAAEIEAALAHASRILPLFTTAHCPSAANNNYWPEMYVNMSIVENGPNREPYSDTPTPRRFGTVSPLDPQLFCSIEEHAEAIASGTPSAKYSPIEVADALDALAIAARTHLEAARSARTGPVTPAFQRAAIDIVVLAGLGRFFAHKLRAGVGYALFDRTKSAGLLQGAIAWYESARTSWAEVVDRTRETYAPDVSYGIGWFQRGHWSDRLAAIDKDIEAMRAKASAATPAPALPRFAEAVTRAPARAGFAIAHTPPPEVARGAALALQLNVTGDDRPLSVRCLYRRTHQALAWESATMTATGGRWQVSLPAALTDSAFPVQYYFELLSPAGRPALYPGFNATWSNTPYFVCNISSR